MGAEMQALHDLRELRGHLMTAKLSREAMSDRSVGQHRRDLANIAFSRALERIFEVLVRLDAEPMQVLPASKPTLAVFEEMLASIDAAEAKLRRMA